MPRADDPKRSVRLAPEDLAMLESASQRHNIAVGALIRESIRRGTPSVLADVSAGRLMLRRRSAAEAPSSSAAPSREAVGRAVELPGVQTARDLMLDRQRKLNERWP